MNFLYRSASVAVENQADCIAGAWAKYAKEQGWLNEQDDLQDVNSLLELIGSREGRARDHGTAAERLKAFQMSYEGGIKACNSFFPRSPKRKPKPTRPCVSATANNGDSLSICMPSIATMPSPITSVDRGSVG